MELLKQKSKGKAVEQLQAALNKLGYNLVVDGVFGDACYDAVTDFQRKKGLSVDGLVGKNTWGLIQSNANAETGSPSSQESGAPTVNDDLLITRSQLKKIVRYASDSNINLYFEYLNKAMKSYNINTPLRIAHFLAQLAHESGSFRYHEELASGQAYEGRADLGNTEPGDGVKFKGRGLIQLTGRANYEQYGKYIGRNLTDRDNMKQVAEPELATDVAAWYWDTRKINVPADKDDVEKVTRKINGGLNGLDDRIKYLSWAKEALHIT